MHLVTHTFGSNQAARLCARAVCQELYRVLLEMARRQLRGNAWKEPARLQLLLRNVLIDLETSAEGCRSISLRLLFGFFTQSCCSRRPENTLSVLRGTRWRLWKVRSGVVRTLERCTFRQVDYGAIGVQDVYTILAASALPDEYKAGVLVLRRPRLERTPIMSYNPWPPTQSRSGVEVAKLFALSFQNRPTRFRKGHRRNEVGTGLKS